MPIVTLSRELGSLGTEIANTLASRLGYCALDKESLGALLWKLGLTRPQFERDDEKSPGFWEQFSQEKLRYLNFMKAALYRFAGEKDCIIIGRGGNIVFRGVPGTLRIRVVAPLKVRAARLRQRLGIDEAHALRMIHQSDHDRAGYHKFFFNTAWDSSADYDLIVNTAGISPAEICDAVSALLRSPTYCGVSSLTRDALRDLGIAQDAVIGIIYREKVAVLSLEVACDKGVVSLHGTVRTPAAADACVRIAGAVEGVTKVVSYLEVAELLYYPGM